MNGMEDGMGAAPRIVLIHATSVAIEPIRRAAARGWPEAEAVDLFDGALSVDREKAGEITPALAARIGRLADYAEDLGARGILFTCSAFGGAIEAAASRAAVPVLKPNEAMFDAAFDRGDRIALLCSFAPAVASMVAEFEAEAGRRGSRARITPHLCEAALAALRSGEADRHDKLIAEAAAGITGADAILLAQFSMSRAAPLCRERSAIPVLTSPETAIARLREMVEEEVLAC